MLILSRGCDSSIRIGPNITIKVLAIQKQRVKLGVDAPSHVRVLREEVTPDDDDGASGKEGQQGSPAVSQAFPILVVEDHPLHARLIAKALGECSLFRVTVAGTGAVAIEALSATADTPQSRPRLVFLDYHLPDMSGVDVLRCIRSRPGLKMTPVVILSGEQREAIVAECLEAGANAFVVKADHLDDFHRSVIRTATFWTSECRIPAPCMSPMGR